MSKRLHSDPVREALISSSDEFNRGATHGYECGWRAHRQAMQAALRRIVNQPPMLGEPLLKPVPKLKRKGNV